MKTSQQPQLLSHVRPIDPPEAGAAERLEMRSEWARKAEAKRRACMGFEDR